MRPTTHPVPPSKLGLHTTLFLVLVVYLLVMVVFVRTLPVESVGGTVQNFKLGSLLWDFLKKDPTLYTDFESPVVVTGTAGTGTRVANDILEHAGGVFMGLRRNAQRDNADFDELVKRHVEDVLKYTNGDINYDINQLPKKLASMIRQSVILFFNRLEADALDKVGSKGRWGFKESQAMFFLPFLYERYPGMRLVQVVRDGRDIAFSKQQRAKFQERYVRSVTKTEADMNSEDYAAAVITTWQKINLSVMEWLTSKSFRYFVVRLEDMCGLESDGTTAKLLYDVLGDRDTENAVRTVNKDKCRLKKYMSRPINAISRLESIAGDGLKYFNYSLSSPSSFSVSPNPSSSISNNHNNNNDNNSEWERPVVVTGTAGTGTRVASDILEHAGGVFMGLNRNEQRDNLDFINIVKPHVNAIIKATDGNINYHIKDLYPSIVDKIRSDVKRFADRMERDARSKAGSNGRWGFKDSQAMFFLPFLYERYPGMRLVQVVRDGRDVAFSKQQRAKYQEQYVRAVTNTKATLDSNDYAKAVIKTWQTINLNVVHWLSYERYESDYVVVRLEDLCNEETRKEHTDKLLSHVLGIRNHSDSTKTIDAKQCRTAKYKDKDKTLVDELAIIGEKGLAYFGFIDDRISESSLHLISEDLNEIDQTKPSDTAQVTESDLSFEQIIQMQSSKARYGRKEIVLLVNDIRYKEVFLNWLILASRVNLTNIVLISLDKEMHSFSQKLGVPSIYFFEDKEPSRKKIPMADIWVYRIEIMRRILNMDVGVHMIDTDSFIMFNPYTYLHHDLYDIESMSGDFPFDVKWKTGTINGGFLRIASNDITRQFYEILNQRVKTVSFKDDQYVINHLLQDMGVVWKEQRGCLHNFGVCQVGVTTKDNIFKNVTAKDHTNKALKVRLLDKSHFPVLASFNHNECSKKFYLLRKPNEKWEENTMYYTPIVVHPAGSPKEQTTKLKFFKSNGLWFLDDNYATVPLTRKNITEGLNQSYLSAIAVEEKLKVLDQMSQFFEYKLSNARSNENRPTSPCYL